MCNKERKRIMLFDINSIVEGRYYPGTFILGIDKSFYEGMRYDSFSRAEMATLTHEYIHYLQDISTLQGLQLFEYRAKLFQLNIAIVQSEQSVHIPIDLENCGIPNAYAQKELLSFFEGGRLEKKIHHINKIQIEKEELLDEILEINSDYKGESISQVSIYYNDEKYPTILGYHYIVESMAYLVERYCFDAEERTREFPYNVCEMVCEIVCPELLSHPECLVAICELSLMHEHSGMHFYLTLKHLKDTRIDFTNIDVLKHYLDYTMIAFAKNQENAHKRIETIIDFMYPPHEPSLKIPNMYVKAMFEAGCKWRKKNHFFITDIFLEQDPVDKIKMWIELFPVPMFVDGINKEIYGAFDSLSMVPVPLSILDYFGNPKNGCPLIEYCKYSGISNVNIHTCKNEPWKHCEKRKKCPLALYFMIYGLDEKKFDIINT